MRTNAVINAFLFPYYSSGHELTLFFEDFEASVHLLYSWCPTTNTTPSVCDDLDGLLFCFCDACQSAHSVCWGRLFLHAESTHSLLSSPLLCRDGKSNYMEGLMLITLYFVIALASAFLRFLCSGSPYANAPVTWAPVWVS